MGSDHYKTWTKEQLRQQCIQHDRIIDGLHERLKAAEKLLLGAQHRKVPCGCEFGCGCYPELEWVIDADDYNSWESLRDQQENGDG